VVDDIGAFDELAHRGDVADVTQVNLHGLEDVGGQRLQPAP